MSHLLRGLVGTILSAVLLGFVAVPLPAQSTIVTFVDTTRITVGDRVTLTISVEHGYGASVAWPDSINLAPFEVLDAQAQPPERSDGHARSTATLVLTVFELGELEIPGIEVEVLGPDGSVEMLTTDRYGIEVGSVGDDETGDIRGIRGPLGIPMSAARLVFLSLFFSVLGAVAYLMLRRIRRHISNVSEPFSASPPRPADAVALEALDRLSASPMLERGHVKEYHIEVSDILRRYVEMRFGVPALEMTTWEVVEGLAWVETGSEFIETLRRFLDRCDMVKFAKVRPDSQSSHELLDLGRSLVKRSALRVEHSAVEVAPVVEYGGER